MSISSSIKEFVDVVKRDYTFQKNGSTPGKYLLHNYIGRLSSRLNRTSPKFVFRQKVNGQVVEFRVHSEQLGPVIGVFSEREYDHTPYIQQPSAGKKILDLGSNVGLAAIYLNAFYPDSEFICIEADPRNIPLLKENLGRNKIKNVVIQKAIFSTLGKIHLKFGRDSTCSTLENSSMHNHDDSVEVELTTVNKLLQDNKWNEIDILKMDIEGTEDELLRDNNEWLAKTKLILLEIHPNTTEEKIQSYIAPYGFKLKKIVLRR